MTRRVKLRAGPAGVHLFERATGLNVLLDECVLAKEEWAPAPRFVSVAVTNACDLECPYCYAPKHAATASRERLTGWLSELDSLGCLGVGFGGGEPTLWRDLPLLCETLVATTGLAVTMTTHGHRFDDRLADRLRGNVHFVRVSVDGVGSTYESLRGRSFSDLRRRLATVRSTAPFGINFVVNRSTMPDLSRAAALAVDEGAAELLLLPEQPVGGRGGIEPDMQRQLLEWVKTNPGIVRLATSQSSACDLPTCDPLAAETGLRAYAHIDASGCLKRSSYDTTGVAIGGGDVMTAIRTLSSTSEARA